MAIPFTPYPVPQQPENNEWMQLSDRMQQMLALAGQYQMQKRQQALQESNARQERAWKIAQLVGDYGEEAAPMLRAAGIPIEGFSNLFDAPAPAVGPIQAPANAPMQGPMPGVQGPENAPVQGPAFTPPKVFTEMGPEAIAEVRRRKGKKGLESWLKEQEFTAQQTNRALDSELKRKQLAKEDRAPAPTFVGTQGNAGIFADTSDPASPSFKTVPLPGQGPLMPKNAPIVPAAQATEIGDFESLVSQLQTVKQKYRPEYVGAYDSRKQALKQATGFGASADAAQFKGALAGVRNKLLNLLSGAAISPAEYERLSQQLPDEGSSEVDFMAKLGLFEGNLKNVVAQRKGSLTAAGYAPMSGGAPAPTPTPAPGAGTGAGRYEAARTAAMQALQVNPNDEKARRALEIANKKLGI